MQTTRSLPHSSLILYFSHSVLATKELKELTSKLESLLTRTGADQTEYKSLLQSLVAEVRGSASAKGVISSSADVKTGYNRSTADVASNLRLIMTEFKSKTRDSELVQALTAVVKSAAPASSHLMQEAREAELAAELQAARDRELTATNERLKLERELKTAAAAIDAANKRFTDAVQAGVLKTAELESRLRALELQLKLALDRESEFSTLIKSERAKCEAALKSVAEREAERSKELSVIKAELITFTAAFDAIKSAARKSD